MALIINVRGTNGSGKSTLVRDFAYPGEDMHGGPVTLARYDSPTKKEPWRRAEVTGQIEMTRQGSLHPTTIVVGSYRTACGGMDALPSFEVSQRAVREAARLAQEHQDLKGHREPGVVLAEGVLASTVYGSWAVFDREMEAAGHRFAWTYMSTPLEVCLERIRERQRRAGREREIKEGLVADKVRAIAATRARALADGRLVYDLPFGNEPWALREIMNGVGEKHRAH